MDVLIVYDSHFGSTTFVARVVAATFTKFAHVRLLPASQATPDDIEDADLLVVGSSWGLSPDLQRWIDQLPRNAWRSTPVVAFDTQQRRAGGSATRIFGQALAKRGASLVLPPETFYVTNFGGTLERGEPDHAAAWALNIASKFVAAGV